MNKFKKLQLTSLDKKFAKFTFPDLPRKGWISVVRSSLSMTMAQLAKRLGITPQAITQFEKSEINKDISLKSLEKIAAAMNCELHYALLPRNKSLSKILEEQAYKKAAKIVENVDTTMALEQQQVKNKKQSIKPLAKELLENYNSKIWEDD